MKKTYRARTHRAEEKAARPPNTLQQPGFSRLTPQVKDWDEDLPEINESQSAPPVLSG